MGSNGIVDVDEERELLHDHRIEKLPPVDDEGRLAGLVTLRDLAFREQVPRGNADTVSMPSGSSKWPDVELVAGNVATSDGFQELVAAGAAAGSGAPAKWSGKEFPLTVPVAEWLMSWRWSSQRQK